MQEQYFYFSHLYQTLPDPSRICAWHEFTDSVLKRSDDCGSCNRLRWLFFPPHCNPGEFLRGLYRVVDGKPLIRKPVLDLFRSSGNGRDDRRSFLSDFSSLVNVTSKL
jgi:hypothetical protein